MLDGDSFTGGIERRGVLSALAAGLGGVGFARSSLAREFDALDRPGFVVEQDDRCVPITPLSGEKTAEKFYDYRTPNTEPSGWAYSSYGTTDLQRPETSICFLYDGPKGLSLVLVHDKLEDGTNGGAVTFDLGFDHPDRGKWAVGDDIYEGSTNYDTFTETAEGWTVDWTWSDGRSDGGVYRPLGDDFAVTIDPAFNEAADLYGDHYEGKITDWQVLSGDRSDPQRVSLDLDRPVTIRAGACGARTTTTTTTRTETTTEEETTTEDETTSEEDSSSDEKQSSGPISADVEIVAGKVNPVSHGRLPVVVRSDESFDATTIAPGTVAFGPGSARPAKRVGTDRDGDGRTDLKLHFWLDTTGIDWTTDRVRLTARTEDGQKVVGTAEVELVPNGGDDEDGENDEGGDDAEGKPDEKDERDEEDERERKEEKREKKEEKEEKKEEKWEDKREQKEKKWEEKEEKLEEKWEKKEEKWEKKWGDDEDEEDEDEDD